MKLPKGRSLAEFGSLSAAEQKLLDACANGESATIGTVLPQQEEADNTVRASFVAFLAMGGDADAPVHHRGVRLQGAWITGDLDLRSALVLFDLDLSACRLAGAAPELRDAELSGSLFLSRSQAQGLSLDGAVVKGDVFLEELEATDQVRLLGAQLGGNLQCEGAKLNGNGGQALSMDRAVVKGNVLFRQLEATGQVRLLGAQLGGDLGCQGAKLNGNGGHALSMDRAVVKGSVFFRELEATGQVRLLGAQLGGSLECEGAKLDGNGGDALSMDRAVVKGNVLFRQLEATGQVRLLGAQLGGDLGCQGAKLNVNGGGALAMEGAQVVGTWFLRDLQVPLKRVALTGCKVGRLLDDQSAWGGELCLDGFEYGRLVGDAPVDAKWRIDWLLHKQRKQDLGKEDASRFKPQPWLQLQKVLRDMGHVEDARQVAIALEDHRRNIGLVGQTPGQWNKVRRGAYRQTSVFLHWAFKVLIGYGYRPLRLVGWMALVWLCSAAVFWFAALQGAMGPSNPLVFNDPKLQAICHSNWYLCKELPEEYTGFSPLAYSLDVLLPLVNLEQEKDWAPLIPTPEASWWNEWLTNWSLKHVVRLVVWAEILFGWIASLLLVAVLSGLTKRREE